MLWLSHKKEGYMKIYYQKRMNCPYCGKEILNEGKTDDSGLFQEEKFYCGTCHEELNPYGKFKKMYIVNGRLFIDLYLNVNRTWNYKIYTKTGQLLKKGTTSLGIDSSVYGKDVLKNCIYKFRYLNTKDTIRIVSCTNTGRNHLVKKLRMIQKESKKVLTTAV